VIKLICNDHWNCIEKCTAMKLLALWVNNINDQLDATITIVLIFE